MVSRSSRTALAQAQLSWLTKMLAPLGWPISGEHEDATVTARPAVHSAVAIWGDPIALSLLPRSVHRPADAVGRRLASARASHDRALLDRRLEFHASRACIRHLGPEQEAVLERGTARLYAQGCVP